MIYHKKSTIVWISEQQIFQGKRIVTLVGSSQINDHKWAQQNQQSSFNMEDFYKITEK